MPERAGAISRTIVCTATALALLAAARASRAQMTDAMSGRDSTAHASASARIQAVGIISRVDPGIGTSARTEAYLTQPMIMAHASALRGHVSGVLTLDFEGLTLERGQLTPGAYGEGYADRRHPHTYLHEAIAVVSGAVRGTGVSLAGGKGFATFGTDDPMVRPFAAYPVNHHLAQVLERYMIAGAVRRGPVSVEASVFNGDEPLSAGSAPDASRFGDSWATRATLSARSGLELQGSYAFVTSPELVSGGGLDQRKWSAAARIERASGPLRYALVEWATTEALFGDVLTNRFTSVLAEASTEAKPVTLGLRYENTTRPEEQRLTDPYRTSRSPTDLSILGITRWQTVTATASVPRRVGKLDVAPLVEVAYARPTEELTPSAFVPRDFYGASSIWMISGGLRLGLGPSHDRMGRYGVAVPNARRSAASPHGGHTDH
ncbi:MAG TPA: hypothetical protein VM076_09805 [Gemmatimonadaceae bacterium]|nr:hypothetical protein [Gemmatimonadaceae bacterium]